MVAFVLAGVLSACNGGVEKPGDPGFYADDPTVDLKRRDVPAAAAPVDVDRVLSTFQIEDGFKIELFAAEPLVTDPVAMEIDEHGRLYVVELHGYPDDKTGTSTVKRLQDTDGDGRPDTSIVFADGLGLPKGVMAWNGGLIVTDPPDVLFLKDDDGDGRADTRRTLLTGFGTANPQLGVNNPIFGLDNWIYLAHTDPSTELSIVDGGGNQRAVAGAARRNLRFRPDLETVEVLASRSQFGHTFDAWGHHFLMTNSNPFFHEAISAHYLKRNADLLVSETTQDLSTYGDPPLVYPITPDSSFVLTNEGAITSASGNLVYLGGAFPDDYDDVIFVAEPIYNVVHAARLRKDGSGFAADRLIEGREFLASTDRWFRPVNLYIGPDGAMYVLDYSRQVIEQPKFLTQEILESVDIYNGVDRGRIYRISAQEADVPQWLDGMRIGDASSDELVRLLEDSNVWKRRTAQRLLVAGGSDEALSLIRRVATESSRAEARVHALWTLEGLGGIEPHDIEKGLRDGSAGVRENALRLAELHLSELDEPEELLGRMVDDADPHVRYQLLLTLGDLSGSSASELRTEMLFGSLEDEWMQVAGLSAEDVDAQQLFERAVADASDEMTAGRRTFFQRLGSVIGAEGRASSVTSVMNQSLDGSESTSWWRAASLRGLAQGLRPERLSSLDLDRPQDALLARFFEETDEVRAAALDLLVLFGIERGKAGPIEHATSIAADQDADAQLRADAVRLLALAEGQRHQALLEDLIDPTQPASVQQAAVAGLGKLGDDETGRFLLSKWSSMTPAVRSQTVEVLIENRGWLFQLFDAIESRRVSPTAIPRHRDEDLVEHRDPEIRRRANLVLRRDAGERRAVVDKYQPALRRAGDPESGRTVFAQVCSSCHQVGGESGVAIGPDMATIENRPPHWLMEAILVPNKAVAEGHDFWTITLNDGEKLYGVIAGETPTSVTVRAIGGAETVVRRTNIETMEAAENSAMPEGLEEQITVQQMADLLAFLMTVQKIN